MKKVYCKDCKWNQETIFPYPYCVLWEVHADYHNTYIPAGEPFHDSCYRYKRKWWKVWVR